MGFGSWILVLIRPGLYLEIFIHVLYRNKSQPNLFTDLLPDDGHRNSCLLLKHIVQVNEGTFFFYLLSALGI